MTLTPKGYSKRLIDKNIQNKLATFGAVSVEGPKWCGKTWTVLNNANSIVYLMKKEMRLRAELDISTALEGNHPHGIDEWQEVPSRQRDIQGCYTHHGKSGR